MIEWLDSAYPPSAAQIVAAIKAGYGGWAGYFAGPNILNGWAKSDFDRVKESGLKTMAYCSGWSDPAAMKAQSISWGVQICLDDEPGIRPHGTWTQDWLNTSGAGQYGNYQYHISAAFHVLAAYPTSGDPTGVDWWTQTPRPAGITGWQWAGSHGFAGITVDSSWFDDAIGLMTFGPGGGSISTPTPRRTRTIATSDSYLMFGIGDDDAIWYERFDSAKGWVRASLGGQVSDFDLSGAGQRVDIYARGLTDRHAYHWFSNDAGVTFSAFELLGGTYKAPLVAVGPAPAAASTPEPKTLTGTITGVLS